MSQISGGWLLAGLLAGAAGIALVSRPTATRPMAEFSQTEGSGAWGWGGGAPRSQRPAEVRMLVPCRPGWRRQGTWCCPPVQDEMGLPACRPLVNPPYWPIST